MPSVYSGTCGLLLVGLSSCCLQQNGKAKSRRRAKQTLDWCRCRWNTKRKRDEISKWQTANVVCLFVLVLLVFSLLVCFRPSVVELVCETTLVRCCGLLVIASYAFDLIISWPLLLENLASLSPVIAGAPKDLFVWLRLSDSRFKGLIFRLSVATNEADQHFLDADD